MTHLIIALLYAPESGRKTCLVTNRLYGRLPGEKKLFFRDDLMITEKSGTGIKLLV